MIKGKVIVNTETIINYENHFRGDRRAISISADYKEGVLRAYLRESSKCRHDSLYMRLEESDVSQLIELLQDFQKFIEMHGEPQQEKENGG